MTEVRSRPNLDEMWERACVRDDAIKSSLALLPEDMQACIKETENVLHRLLCTFHFNDMPLNDWEDRLRDRLYDCVNNWRGTLTEVLVQEAKRRQVN